MKSASESEESEEFFDAEDTIPNGLTKWVHHQHNMNFHSVDCVCPFCSNMIMLFRDSVVFFAVLRGSRRKKQRTQTNTFLEHKGFLCLLFPPFVTNCTMMIFFHCRKKSPKSHADERFDFPTPEPVVVATIRPPEDIELQRPLRLNQPSSSASMMNQSQHEFAEPRSVRIYICVWSSPRCFFFILIIIIIYVLRSLSSNNYFASVDFFF